MNSQDNQPKNQSGAQDGAQSGNLERATFACGCFWGVESRFQQIDGVISTQVGYTGGTTADPTYKSVCAGSTGHAEAVEVVFDPARVTYEALLDRFFAMHNPTDGGDTHGGQYRAAVFYHSTDQETAVRQMSRRIEARLGSALTTQIAAATTFFRAEEYHQDYYKKKGGGHC